MTILLTLFLHRVDVHLRWEILEYLRMFVSFTDHQWSALLSKIGCQEQIPHCDYAPGEPWPRRALAPHGVLVALQHDTTFVCWPGSHNMMRYYHAHKVFPGTSFANRVEVKIPKGSLLLFRHLLVHAGAAYLVKENFRLHCYLQHGPIPRNFTFKLNVIPVEALRAHFDFPNYFCQLNKT